MKTFIPKQVPTIVKYRDYRKFNEENFRQDLANKISNITNDICYDLFEKTFIDTLNKHAPINTKYARANNAPFINKTLSKAIMTRFRLKNKYHKSPNNVNILRYRKQRNYCVNLTRRIKKNYFSNLDINKVIDNKKFWDTIKPCFSEKNTSTKRITLIENDNIITEEGTLAETFNTFFSTGTKDNETRKECKSSMTLDIHEIIAKFKNHPSIIKIKEKTNCGAKFSFVLSSLDDIKKRINNLNITKPTTYNNIPANILVEYCDVCAHPIHKLYNKLHIKWYFSRCNEVGRYFTIAQER